MPRIYGIDDEIPDEAYDDEDFDPFLAAPEAFQYLPAPEIGGPEGPVYVAVRVAEVGNIAKKPSLYERLTGRADKHTPSDWQIKAERESAKLASALAELGAVRAYIRYDGGNDEGFAWFDHCVFRDGSMRDADQLARDLETARVKVDVQVYQHGGQGKARAALDDLLALSWAVALLGRGYGTGEYVMYGAFSVDLQTGLATDDPDPAPITRNLRLKDQ